MVGWLRCRGEYGSAGLNAGSLGADDGGGEATGGRGCLGTASAVDCRSEADVEGDYKGGMRGISGMKQALLDLLGCVIRVR